MWYRERVAQRNRATTMCEGTREIVKGDVNGGERVRIGENDVGEMGHGRWREGKRERERESERERW